MRFGYKNTWKGFRIKYSSSESLSGVFLKQYAIVKKIAKKKAWEFYWLWPTTQLPYPPPSICCMVGILVLIAEKYRILICIPGCCQLTACRPNSPEITACCSRFHFIPLRLTWTKDRDKNPPWSPLFPPSPGVSAPPDSPA